MSMYSSLLRFASGIVLGVAMVSAEAGAQTCASPSLLTVNTSQWLNTCQGDGGLVIACYSFALTGPAGVMRIQLPYPVGQLSVQSMSVGYDPVLFLMHSQCSSSASCGTIVDSGIVIDTLDLAEVDSGNYFLTIAPIHFDSSPCGWVIATYSLTPQQQALALDGVFRGGISAPSPNP